MLVQLGLHVTVPLINTSEEVEYQFQTEDLKVCEDLPLLDMGNRRPNLDFVIPL